MSTKYKATTTEEAFFITITTVGWVDVFTRLNQKYVLINSLAHCQKKQGIGDLRLLYYEQPYPFIVQSNQWIYFVGRNARFQKIHLKKNNSNYD